MLFYSFTDDNGDEVARAQINPKARTGEAYPAWKRPTGPVTEIDLLEVRPHLRGRSIGTAVVRLLLDVLDAPTVALALDAKAEEFWRTTIFTEYEHPEISEYHPDGPRPMSLFVYEG